MEVNKIYRIIENTDLLSKETLSELQQITEKYPFFQAGWLLYLKNLKLTGDERFAETLKKAALLVPDRKQLFRLLSSSYDSLANSDYFNRQEINREHAENEPGDHDAANRLINKFLSEKEAHGKKGRFLSEDQTGETGAEIIAKSLTERDELVTETLAGIFVEQKKYDKALDAYKKLSLKYPEKSVYFANRIEEVEKLKKI